MAQRAESGPVEGGSAELFFLPVGCRSERRDGAIAGLGDGFWKRPRPGRLSWLKTGLAFPLADFVVLLLTGPSALVLADVSVALDSPAWVLCGAMPVVTVGTLYERGLYGRRALLQPARLRQVALGWFQAFGLLLLAAVAWSSVAGEGWSRAGSATAVAGLSGSWIAAFSVVGLAGLLSTRALWSALREHLVGEALVHGRAVVVGAGRAAERVVGRLRDDPASGLEVVGLLDDGAEQRHPSLGGVAVLGGVEDMAEAVRHGGVDTVIVALPWTAEARIAAAIAAAERLPVDIRLAPDTAASGYWRCPRGAIAGQPLLDVRDRPISGAKAVAKRAEDVVIASLVLLVLSPVLLAVAVAIKLESRGPVFFKQPRRGFNNRVFDLYKFRSMHAHMADTACVRQTGRGDPRVTRVGAYLRRHSLDELPQLLNVLRGEMSLVGPRPHALATRTEGLLLEDAVDAYVARFRVKPGITGWAQVNGARGDLDSRAKLQRRVALDLEYIERWSLLLDLRIIARSALCMVHDNDAF